MAPMIVLGYDVLSWAQNGIYSSYQHHIMAFQREQKTSISRICEFMYGRMSRTNRLQAELQASQTR